MTSFSGPAGSSSGTCIACGVPISSNGNATLECAECRTPPPDLATRLDPCEAVTVDRDGVTLRKAIEPDGSSYAVEYTLSSSRPDRVRFRLLDRLPGEAETSDGSEEASDGAGLVDVTWWLPARDDLSFQRRFDHDGTEQDRACEPRSIDVVPRLRIEAADGVAGPDETVAGDARPDDWATEGAISTGEERTRDQVDRTRENGEGTDEQADRTSDEAVPTRKKEERTGDEVADANAVAEDVSILAAIPAYDEAATIGDVVRETWRYADAVLVVDDGSEDDTCRRAWAAGAFVQRHESNRGYGATLQTIFDRAAAVDVDHLVVLDGDGQHDPADVPKLVASQRESGAELVIGNRFDADVETDIPRYRRFGVGVINVLTNLSLGGLRSDGRIVDTQSGFRCYSNRAVRSLREDDTIGDRMGVSTDILYHAHRHDYGIDEVGTSISYEGEKTSTRNPIDQGYMLVRNVLPILERERPLFALGVPGFVLAVSGMGLSVLSLGQFAQSGIFPGLWMFASLAVALIGVLACLTGLMVHSVKRYHDYTR